MSFQTKFTRALGITHPIMCGGLHWVGYAQLAAAVSESGGIGLITALVRRNVDLRFFSNIFRTISHNHNSHKYTSSDTTKSRSSSRGNSKVQEFDHEAFRSESHAAALAQTSELRRVRFGDRG